MTRGGGLYRLEVMGALQKVSGVAGTKKGWRAPLWSGGRHSEVAVTTRKVAGATRCNRLSIYGTCLLLEVVAQVDGVISHVGNLLSM